ncbi:hypothetical protein GCM10010306_035320 [Streptomyces umbrinus]|nr:hypothetical protein GCM10010306_035320 [Streptomyces umbrinus]GHH46300.1 hypothetical protein GCM10018775_37180 [Streptomyces umbrinus]
MNASLGEPGNRGVSVSCGLVVAGRAHAAEPHMSQPRAPEGAPDGGLVLQSSPVFESKECQP